ncbi:hypothetical protein [Palleronia sp. LCG004]|uniref:hypothetical protein n=1 Tax=Palleronia sp. LCG004 TaxID=3079304 RepID=UPI002943A632|nr:hypothetical protein [Palleronia sp. LCG004]WOI55866.1 hypothetical protein RVY76_12610 [Palleronia sp. LCG004]
MVYPLPVVKNYPAQTGADSRGRAVSAYDTRYNPVAAILLGFDEVWQFGDKA